MLYSKTPDIERLSIGDENRTRGRRRMGDSAPCLKWLVIFINFLLMLGGLGLLGAGVYALMAPSYLLSMLGSRLLGILAVLFIVTGSLVCVFTFIGCCGAKYENKCLLGVYILLIVSGLICLITCLSVIYANEEDVKQAGATLIRKRLKFHYGFNNTFTDLVDRVQSDLRCCAVLTGRADFYMSTRWFHSQPHDVHRLSLPQSCCLRNAVGKFVNQRKCQTAMPRPETNSFYNTEGCVDALWDLWQTYRGYIVGSGAAVVAILIILFVTTTCFMCQIRRYSSSGGVHV